MGRGWGYQHGLFRGGVVCSGDSDDWYIAGPVGGVNWLRKHASGTRRRAPISPSGSAVSRASTGSSGVAAATPGEANAGKRTGRKRLGKKRREQLRRRLARANLARSSAQLRRDGALLAADASTTASAANGVEGEEQQQQPSSSTSAVDGGEVGSTASTQHGELTGILREGRPIILVNPDFVANGREEVSPPPAIGQVEGREEGHQKHESDLSGQDGGAVAVESPIRGAESNGGREEMAAVSDEERTAVSAAAGGGGGGDGREEEESTHHPSSSSSSSSDSESSEEETVVLLQRKQADQPGGKIASGIEGKGESPEGSSGDTDSESSDEETASSSEGDSTGAVGAASAERGNWELQETVEDGFTRVSTKEEKRQAKRVLQKEKEKKRVELAAKASEEEKRNREIQRQIWAEANQRNHQTRARAARERQVAQAREAEGKAQVY